MLSRSIVFILLLSYITSIYADLAWVIYPPGSTGAGSRNVCISGTTTCGNNLSGLIDRLVVCTNNGVQQSTTTACASAGTIAVICVDSYPSGNVFTCSTSQLQYINNFYFATVDYANTQPQATGIPCVLPTCQSVLTYSYQALAYTTCSASCGTGTQTQILTCVDNNNQQYSDSTCTTNGVSKPAPTTISCTVAACTTLYAYVFQGFDTACTGTCATGHALSLWGCATASSATGAPWSVLSSATACNTAAAANSIPVTCISGTSSVSCASQASGTGSWPTTSTSIPALQAQIYQSCAATTTCNILTYSWVFTGYSSTCVGTCGTGALASQWACAYTSSGTGALTTILSSQAQCTAVGTPLTARCVDASNNLIACSNSSWPQTSLTAAALSAAVTSPCQTGVICNPPVYGWVFGAYTLCPVTCGNGTRTRTVTCASFDSLAAQPVFTPTDASNCASASVSNNRCVARNLTVVACTNFDTSLPAVTSKTCVNPACIAYAYIVEPFTPCVSACGTQVQTRSVRCASYDPTAANAVLTFAPDYTSCQSTSNPATIECADATGAVDACVGTVAVDSQGVPITQQTCPNLPCAAFAWVISVFPDCPNTCGTATVTRSVVCATYDPTVAVGGVLTFLSSNAQCLAAPLLTSTTGGAVTYGITSVCLDDANNNVPCSGSAYNVVLAAGVAPVATQQCVFGPCCHWTQSSWSLCPKCGPAQQSSIVSCLDSNGQTQPNTCCTSQIPTPPPATQRDCLNQPACVVGDPEFVGFLGQKYEVHGVPDSVFNIITSPWLQYNALFSLLSDKSVHAAQCNRTRTHPWTHSGTYLGQVGFKTHHDRILIESGSCLEGIKKIQVNGKDINIGDKIKLSTIDEQNQMITLIDAFTIQLDLAEVTITLTNSDYFFNQEVQLTAYGNAKHMTHGLLGQTWRGQTYVTKGVRRVYEGVATDYMIQDEQLFGDDFIYNKYTE